MVHLEWRFEALFNDGRSERNSSPSVYIVHSSGYEDQKAHLRNASDILNETDCSNVNTTEYGDQNQTRQDHHQKQMEWFYKDSTYAKH